MIDKIKQESYGAITKNEEVQNFRSESLEEIENRLNNEAKE